MHDRNKRPYGRYDSAVDAGPALTIAEASSDQLASAELLTSVEMRGLIRALEWRQIDCRKTRCNQPV
jgi:hypothetical protein